MWTRQAAGLAAVGRHVITLALADTHGATGMLAAGAGLPDSADVCERERRFRYSTLPHECVLVATAPSRASTPMRNGIEQLAAYVRSDERAGGGALPPQAR